MPRMPTVATGVPTFMSPVFATCPATKLAAPCIRVNSEVFDVLVASNVRSFSINRALALRLNVVPSIITRPIVEPLPVCTTSFW